MVPMVEDCIYFAKCNFLKILNEDENRKYALRGFIRVYCQGEKQGECVRKKVSKALGGPEKVPANMMPNGMPLIGTSRDEWPAEVKKLVQ